MKLTELLEEEKDALLHAVKSAQTPDEARAAVERTLERMLFAFNDATPSARARESAAAMVGALRAALGLMECKGEPKLYERRRGRGVTMPPLALALLVLGCAMSFAAGGLMLYFDLPAWTALLPVLGMLLVGAAGHPARKAAADTERTIDVPTDWERVYRTLHTAALVMDQTLSDAEAAERWDARRKAAEAPALSEPEAEMMGELLEGLCGGDGDYALEKLGAVRRYLRAKGVEAVDYDAEHAAMFDRMPGTQEATLRPALVQGGAVLRRGLATVKG